MNKILLFLFLSLNLFATDLLEIYRKNGIVEVEKELDKMLKDYNYWFEYLQNKDVEFGYFETKKYIILTKKNETQLSLYKNNNHKLELISKDNVIVGEVMGDKFLEGDKKTPVGAYDLIEKKTSLDPFYGPLALVTSYPNLYDKTQNKKGSGIWIHGMPINEEREKFTKGCIALDNEQLVLLDKNIDFKTTILLTAQESVKKAQKEEIAKILSFIFDWRDSWKYSDIEKYLNFYSSDFKRYDGMEIEEFSKFKRRIFAKNEDKTIKLYNIDISVYPNSLDKNLFRIFMDEEYYSPSVKFIGKKELYVEIINGEVKILVED